MTEREAVALLPCPFCGCRMVDNFGWIRHIMQNTCPIENLSWPMEQADIWNRRAAMGEREVRVKPLEWVEDDPEPGAPVWWESKSLVGKYTVTAGQWWLVGKTPASQHGLDEAAKAAAQEDYERRIRSALEVGEREVTVADAARVLEVNSEVHEILAHHLSSYPLSVRGALCIVAEEFSALDDEPTPAEKEPTT